MSKKKLPEERVSGIPPFGLRMPAELREMIVKSAKNNERSMNSEIIDRLYGSFSGPRITDKLVLDRVQAGIMGTKMKELVEHSIPLGGGATIYFVINDAEVSDEDPENRNK